MIGNEKNAAAKKSVSMGSVLASIRKLASKITTIHLAVLFVLASIFLAYICVAPPTDLPNWPLYRVNTRIWQSLERFGKHVKPYHLRVLTSASQHFESRVLFLITYLGVPEHLHQAGKPLSCEELKPLIDEGNAEAVNLPYLCRVLHAASHFDFLVEAEEHKYELSELGKYLVKSHPKSLNGYIQMIAGDEAFIIATALSRSIFTGNSGFKETYREELLEHLKADPPFQEIFDRGMADNARLVAPAIIADYPSFGSCKHICDIGGGVGSFLYSVLEYYSYGIKGTVFDLTDVIDGAKKFLDEKDVTSEKISLHAGDFFKSIPEFGCDCYILKDILNNWSDEASNAILTNLFAAVTRGNRVLIIERVLHTGGAAEEMFKTQMDLTMMAFNPSHSRLRTQEEMYFLLEQSGFVEPQTYPTRAGYSIIESFPDKEQT